MVVKIFKKNKNQSFFEKKFRGFIQILELDGAIKNVNKYLCFNFVILNL